MTPTCLILNASARQTCKKQHYSTQGLGARQQDLSLLGYLPITQRFF